jgi:hypothetical protein
MLTITHEVSEIYALAQHHVKFVHIKWPPLSRPQIGQIKQSVTSLHLPSSSATLLVPQSAPGLASGTPMPDEATRDCRTRSSRIVLPQALALSCTP